MKTKLLYASIIALTSVCAISIGSTSKIAKALNPTISEATWQRVKSIGENPYSIVGDTIVSSGNSSMRDNYYVTGDYSAIGDYKITTTFQGTMSLPATKEIQAGIIPWYIDDSNYIIAYMDWTDYDRPGDVREVQLTGKINNQPLVVWKGGGFVSSEWNDIWTDGNHTSPNSTISFSVEKKISEDGDSSIFYAYINGEQVGFYGVRDTERYASEEVKVGVYGYNDTFTFSSFDYTSLNNKQTYSKISESYVGKSLKNNWVYNNENESYSLVSETSDWKQNMLLKKNDVENDDYSFETKLSIANSSSNSSVGVMIYYKDEYNYLAGVAKNIDGALYVGFEGKSTYINGAVMNETPLGEMIEKTGVSFKEITSMKAVKNGTSFKLFINNEEVSSYSNSNLTSYGKVGVVESNIDCTFSNLTLSSVNYIPFDWYTSTLGTNNTFTLSTYSKDNPITYSPTGYQFNENAIDPSDATKHAAICFNSGKYDNVSISASFANMKANSEYGLYGWMEDADNYLSVVVKPSGIEITNHFGETIKSRTYALPEGASYAGESKTLSVDINSKVVKVKWYGLEITDATPFVIEGNDASISPNVGLIVGGAAMNVTKVNVNGFNAYDPIVKDDWTFKGARATTWNLDDNGDITGSMVGHTSWMNTLALKENKNQTKNFYMATTINVSESENTEFKTGIVPYYKDRNNYVFVWLSQWAGSDTCVVVTARINGSVVGAEWRETKAGYNYFDTNNEVEIQIEEDTLKVFINKGFNPVFTQSIEGLSKRDLASSYVGFNISNTSASFKNNKFFTESRNYTMTEKPVIKEIGTRKTTGVINKSLTLPVYTASNSANDILDATVKVYDPNNEEIDIKNNKFTPTQVGDYTVKVTCVDAWGNEAEPIEYTIAVNDGSSTPSSAEGDKPTSSSSKKGCKGEMFTSAAGVALLGVALCGVALKKKKEEK